MPILRSPLQSPLRSSLYSPLVGKGGPVVVFSDDFSAYADTAALLAVWTGGGTTPLITLQSAPSRMRLENGGAAATYVYRSFATVIGQAYRLTGNVIAKGANTPRVTIRVSATGTILVTYSATATGAFSANFTATGTTTFIRPETNNATLGHFVEIDDLLIVEA